MDSLFKNSVFNFFSQIIVFLSAALLSIFLARILGPEQMGLYSYWMWLIGTGVLLFTLGLPRSLIRFTARIKPESISILTQIISRIFIYQSKLLLLFFAFAFLVISIIGGEQKFTLLIIVSILFISILNTLLGSALFGLQKYNVLFKINLWISPLSLAFSLIVLFFIRSLNNLLIANLLITLISFLISVYYLRDYLKLKVKPIPSKTYSEIKSYALSTSLIVFLDLILMERSEIFFLKNFSTLEEVAFYSLGFGLVGRVMVLAPGAVSGVIMPKIAWLYGKNELQNIKLTYFSSSRYLILITLPIIFSGIALIDLPVHIFYGPEYSALIPVIRILLISGGSSAVVASAAAVLYGTGGQKFILKLAFSAACVNILLDILLIPTWGAIGAAYANAIAQILGVIAGTIYLVKLKKMPFPWSDSFKILVAGVGAFIIVYSAKTALADFPELTLLLILSLFYIILYLLGLYFLNFFIKQDVDILRKITGKLPFSGNIKL